MTRQVSNLITHILPLAVFVLITNVGTCAEVSAEIKELIASAEQGEAEAQYNLGAAYDKGEGVLKDHKEAVKWYRKAAEQGEAVAQANLGLMYDNGEGVVKDDVIAYAWFNVASANGESDGATARDLIAITMTSEQIAEAQKLSRELFEKY